MSGCRIVGAIAMFVAKLGAAVVLAVIFSFAVLFLTDTECGSGGRDCSWVADVFFTGNGAYFLLAACFILGAGLVWGVPAARRRRRTIRAHDS